MVLLTMTPAMVEAAKYAKESDKTNLQTNEDTAAESFFEDPKAGIPISHEQVVDLAKKLKKLGLETWHGHRETVPSSSLNHLLRGARIYVEPSPPKTEPVRHFEVTAILR